MEHKASAALFARARQVFPGGVSSPVRAFGGVDTTPVCLRRGSGATVVDEDGNTYIDYVGSYGPLILGHAAPDVVEAIGRAAAGGTTFGATVAAEVELGERICQAVASMEKVRFVSSGTEATMSALRLARGFTGRDAFIKFAGCYHGHADPFLVDESGSGLATLGLPGSAGVPQAVTATTLTAPYNDLDAVESLLVRHGGEVAAIVVEPVACNMGLVMPTPEFLPGLRKLCDTYGCLLVFDEVITGFRLALGGAQAHFGVRPDLSCFGKIVGGGLPVGAYGGRDDIMRQVAPLGPVYQAGTLSGNPVAMAAGNAVLQKLAEPDFYPALERRAQALQQGMLQALVGRPDVGRVHRLGSIFHFWAAPMQSGPPRTYAQIKRADKARYAKVFSGLLERGIALAPSAFEVGFVSAAHTEEHVAQTTAAFAAAVQQLPVLDAG